jgi:hypothetical protein
MVLSMAALAGLPGAAQAASGSFSRSGSSPYEASRFTVDPGSTSPSGLAAVPFTVDARVGPNETGRFSVIVCGNGDFTSELDESGLPRCTGFGSKSDTQSRSGEFSGQLPLEAQLPAGSYTARGVVEGNPPQVTDVGSFEVIDECLWEVTAAAGLEPGSLSSARVGDHISCRGSADFDAGPPAPLVQVLALRSGVDRTTLRMEGPGAVSFSPISVAGSARQMQLSLAGEAELRLNTPRRLARKWDTATESATIGQVSGRRTAYIVETSAQGRRTVVRNRGGANAVTTLGRGGIESLPLAVVDRASCIKLRKYTVILRGRQSTTVEGRRPPTGGPRQARRACRRARR